MVNTVIYTVSHNSLSQYVIRQSKGKITGMRNDSELETYYKRKGYIALNGHSGNNANNSCKDHSS